MAERRRTIPDGEGHAEGEQAPNQGAMPANHQPYIKNPLRHPVPSLLAPNNQEGLPSMAESSNNEAMHPVNSWNYSNSITHVPVPGIRGPDMTRQFAQQSEQGFVSAQGAPTLGRLIPAKKQNDSYPAALSPSYPSRSPYTSAYSSMETPGLPAPTPPTETPSPLGASPPSARGRRRPAARSRNKKVEDIQQWSLKQSAFVIYYYSHAYLLSQVQRMFSTEFEGTVRTIKDIREHLEVIEKNGAHGTSKWGLISQVIQGFAQFKTQGDQVPIPSVRDGKKEVEPPLRTRHKNFVSFFQAVGLDSALTHELFELHFEGTITEEQLDDMWKKPVRMQKRLPLEAYQGGWFKYFEEGQIGNVDSRDIQKNISKMKAKARAITKRKKIAGEMREAERREKQEAAAENVDDFAGGETEGSEQVEAWEEADRTVADSIEGEPVGGTKKKPSVRDKRSRKDRERSSSPK